MTEDPNAPSLTHAIAEANESGWYLYQLWQEDTLTTWGCVLRSLTGGHRRDITRGSAADPVLAIYHALGSAPELEAEVSHSGEDRLDLVAALGLRRAKPVLRRI